MYKAIDSHIKHQQMELLIKFTDQSPSFVYGVEFGRLLAKMEQGYPIISNGPFPVRAENLEVLKQACNVYGYTYSVVRPSVDGWVEFIATKIIIIN